jgi:AbrB family looped-hinge helix DNA binding protein
VGLDPLSGNRISIIELLDKLFKSKLDERGRMYIPKTVREKLSLNPGDKIYIKIEDESFIVLTTKAIKKQLGKI